MSDIVIKIENLSKIYRLGEVGTGTISHDLNRWYLMNIRGQEDPYTKIGHVNDRTQEAKKGELVAALRDINLEVNQGEVLGIIGKNGAGKSTLLKLLSRVTSPTSGTIKIKGRLASLLEVGTGFHPEMTGKENIFMNGTIMGMRKWEIADKLDEIVDFAGIAKYLDTPTKRYSSGMTVRLGFAIAAFLEPEILIVDEVLAVGDAEFQRKAIGKMQEVSKGEGRTVLFVSHNMLSIKSLCARCVVLEKGAIGFSGSCEEGISYYLNEKNETRNKWEFKALFKKSRFTIHEISLCPIGKSSNEVLDEYQEIELNTSISVYDDSKSLHLTYVLKNEIGDPLFAFSHIHGNLELKKGKHQLKCIFPQGFLNIGTYYLSLYIIENLKATLFVENNIVGFQIQHGKRPIGSWMGKEPGFIKPKFKWELC